MIEALDKVGTIVSELTVLGSWPRGFPDRPPATQVLPVTRDADFSVVNWLSRRLQSGPCDAIVIDVPWDLVRSGGVELLLSRQKGSTAVIGVDGPQDRDIGFDLIYVPSFHLDSALHNLNTRVVFGWDAYLLRNVVRASARQTRKTLVVGVGGSDVHGLSRIWPAKIRALEVFEEVSWIRGAHAPPPLGVDGWSEFTDYVSPDDPTEIMKKAAYGLAVFGLTFFEFCASGIPCVTYSPYGEKTARQMQALQQSNLGLVAVNPNDAVEKLSRLADFTPRQHFQMRHKARWKLRKHEGARFTRELRRELSHID